MLFGPPSRSNLLSFLIYGALERGGSSGCYPAMNALGVGPVRKQLSNFKGPSKASTTPTRTALTDSERAAIRRHVLIYWGNIYGRGKAYPHRLPGQ